MLTYLEYAVVFANLAVIIAMAPESADFKRVYGERGAIHRRNDLSLGFATLARTIMMLQALGMAPTCGAREEACFIQLQSRG